MKTTFTLLLFGFAGLSVAQDGFLITTDRPSFSESELDLNSGETSGS